MLSKNDRERGKGPLTRTLEGAEGRGKRPEKDFDAKLAEHPNEENFTSGRSLILKKRTLGEKKHYRGRRMSGRRKANHRAYQRPSPKHLPVQKR